jgi:hypothetical protein
VNEAGKMGKIVAVAYFKTFSHHLPEETDMRKSHSG